MSDWDIDTLVRIQQALNEAYVKSHPADEDVLDRPAREDRAAQHEAEGRAR
jgi:hypothetical protein